LRGFLPRRAGKGGRQAAQGRRQIGVGDVDFCEAGRERNAAEAVAITRIKLNDPLVDLRDTRVNFGASTGTLAAGSSSHDVLRAEDANGTAPESGPPVLACGHISDGGSQLIPSALRQH
jgi:hypothetical protein